MLDEVLAGYSKYICGLDEYSEIEYEYPEVYAKFSVALFNKWTKTQDKKYRETAYEYLERMCKLGIETERWAYWGLPFDWGNTEKKDGFLITTCFCVQALNICNDGRWNNLIRKAIAWCLTLISTSKSGQVEMFYSPKLKQNIYNASAMACGTLLSCRDLKTNDRKLLYKVLEYIVKKQKKGGYWNYSDIKCDVDLLHQSYTVEGLMRSYLYIDEPELKRITREAIEKGVNFLIVQLQENIDKSERYLFRITDDEKGLIKIKHLCLRCMEKIVPKARRFPFTRCWSYAALLRVLYYGEYIMDLNCKKEITLCLEKIQKDLFAETYFKYSRNCDKNFVRHQAHMVEALSYVYTQRI